MPVGPEGFKELLSRWASGVSVVTTNDDGMLYGLTVSSFSSLSLDPPPILVCLSNENRLISMVRSCGRFAVSLLGAHQVNASNYFARSGRAPSSDFTEIEGEWTDFDVPVVKGALAWAACSVHELVEKGDHTIVIGQVEHSGVGSREEPLLYFNRGYRTLDLGPER